MIEYSLDPSDVRFGGLMVAAVVVLLLGAAALVQDAPRRFQGCIDADTCYWSDLDRPVRLARIDAPEIGGPEDFLARSGRQVLEQKVRRAQALRIERVCLGKHRRIIAEVYVNGVNLSDWLLRHGYADRYRGRVCY